MYGIRSFGPKLNPLDLEIERTFHRNRRNTRNHSVGLAGQDRAFKDYFNPLADPATSCIELPQIIANHFELKTGILNALPSFYGLDKEDPYNHLNEFLAICATQQNKDVPTDYIRLSLFPFSLKDRAKLWFNSLKPKSIKTWAAMVEKFMNKYFPVHKTNALRKEIADFEQREGEHFYECWDRFNGLLLKCLHHNIDKWRLVQYFHNGLSPQNRKLVDATSGGTLMMKNASEIWEFFETMYENSQQWDWSSHL